MFKIQRIIRINHFLEYLFVHLVFDVTDGQCADSHRFSSPGSERFSIIIDVNPFKAGRGYGIDIGCNQEFARQG